MSQQQGNTDFFDLDAERHFIGDLLDESEIFSPRKNEPAGDPTLSSSTCYSATNNVSPIVFWREPPPPYRPRDEDLSNLDCRFWEGSKTNDLPYGINPPPSFSSLRSTVDNDSNEYYSLLMKPFDGVSDDVGKQQSAKLKNRTRSRSSECVEEKPKNSENPKPKRSKNKKATEKSTAAEWEQFPKLGAEQQEVSIRNLPCDYLAPPPGKSYRDVASGSAPVARTVSPPLSALQNIPAAASRYSASVASAPKSNGDRPALGRLLTRPQGKAENGFTTVAGRRSNAGSSWQRSRNESPKTPNSAPTGGVPARIVGLNPVKVTTKKEMVAREASLQKFGTKRKNGGSKTSSTTSVSSSTNSVNAVLKPQLKKSQSTWTVETRKNAHSAAVHSASNENLYPTSKAGNHSPAPSSHNRDTASRQSGSSNDLSSVSQSELSEFEAEPETPLNSGSVRPVKPNSLPRRSRSAAKEKPGSSGFFGFIATAIMLNLFEGRNDRQLNVRRRSKSGHASSGSRDYSSSGASTPSSFFAHIFPTEMFAARTPANEAAGTRRRRSKRANKPHSLSALQEIVLKIYEFVLKGVKWLMNLVVNVVVLFCDAVTMTARSAVRNVTRVFR